MDFNDDETDPRFVDTGEELNESIPFKAAYNQGWRDACAAMQRRLEEGYLGQRQAD